MRYWYDLTLSDDICYRTLLSGLRTAESASDMGRKSLAAILEHANDGRADFRLRAGKWDEATLRQVQWARMCSSSPDLPTCLTAPERESAWENWRSCSDVPRGRRLV
jgi:hypothetical protein